MSLFQRLLRPDLVSGTSERAQEPLTSRIDDLDSGRGIGLPPVAAPISTNVLGSLEAAANLYSRAFSTARLEPRGNVVLDRLQGAVLGDVARDLIRTGDIVLSLPRLDKAVDYDVRGDTADRSQWSYRLDITVPDGTTQRTQPGSEVLHFRYLDDQYSVKGVAPLATAESLATLATWIDVRLSQEASAQTGSVIPVGPMEAAEAGGIQTAIASLQGRVAVLRSTTDNSRYGGDMRSPTSHDFEPRRVGMEPPATLVDLRRDVYSEVLALTGIPSGILDAAGSASTREALRVWLNISLMPMAERMRAEIELKTGISISFDWERLGATDLAAKGRALKAFVESGMELTQALALSGLMTD